MDASAEGNDGGAAASPFRAPFRPSRPMVECATSMEGYNAAMPERADYNPVVEEDVAGLNALTKAVNERTELACKRWRGAASNDDEQVRYRFAMVLTEARTYFVTSRKLPSFI